MYTDVWLKGVIAFVLALAIGTFVEYWGHRLMHVRVLLGRRHALHHRIGLGQGWFREFRAYLMPAPFLIMAGFVDSPESAIGFAVGSVVYAAFAAYSHQIQHESPELVFWLPQPTHYLHHKHNMWHHNFGISVDFWDRVFRTYLAVEWCPAQRPFDYPVRKFLQINWFHDSVREFRNREMDKRRRHRTRIRRARDYQPRSSWIKQAGRPWETNRNRKRLPDKRRPSIQPTGEGGNNGAGERSQSSL